MERVCKKTLFEVEGWRKILPLMDILEKNVTTDAQKIKLEMIPIDPIFEKNVFDKAFENRDATQLSIHNSNKPRKTIKNSWIYEHFSNKNTKQSKIALYVNQIIHINQNLNHDDALDKDFWKKSIGNHCAIAVGLAKWPKNNPNGIECLELEIHGGSDEMRYIPVEFPFFEDIQIEIYKIAKNGSYNSAINKLGKKWVTKKWGNFEKIEQKWYEEKKANQEWKYQMFFVRGIHPCFRLKFKIDNQQLQTLNAKRPSESGPIAVLDNPNSKKN